jgi:hypothetical protein
MLGRTLNYWKGRGERGRAREKENFIKLLSWRYYHTGLIQRDFHKHKYKALMISVLINNTVAVIITNGQSAF